LWWQGGAQLMQSRKEEARNYLMSEPESESMPEPEPEAAPEAAPVWVTDERPVEQRQEPPPPPQLPWWAPGVWPGLTRASAAAVVNEYGAAWMAQDEERITAIFAEDAVYKEHPYDPQLIYRGRAGIRRYWVEHVKGKQRELAFRQAEESLLLDNERQTVLAKWEAKFKTLQVPLRNCLFTPELQWQSRGKRRISQGCVCV
jgi:ketosteroid isomerase-like protein